VTGTPGTGKSTFAKRLASRLEASGVSSSVIEINSLVNRYGLFSGRDRTGAKIVKIAQLNRRLSNEISKAKGAVIVVGHLVPELRVNQKITIVTRLDLRPLERRLKARHYGGDKMREDLVSEALDYCGVNSVKKGVEQYQVETDREKENAIRYLLSVAKGAKAKRPKSVERSKLNQLIGLINGGNRYRL
jgi:broad-specificity NMP kinase